MPARGGMEWGLAAQRRGRKMVVARVGGTRGVDDDKRLTRDLRAQWRVDVETVFDPPWSHGVGGAKRKCNAER